SLHILVIDKYVASCDPLLLSCGQFIFSAAVSVILALLFDDSSLSAVWECRMPVLYAGIMSCAVAHTLQMIGQKTAKPTQASLVLSLESVFSAISGYLFLREILSAREFAGCLIIFGAILLSHVKGKGEKRSS
ncbi:MAG: DMT family transporter, partial [Clostridia bacterium]|nr:DMT family transporter [Clostridia bacterium]